MTSIRHHTILALHRKSRVSKGIKYCCFFANLGTGIFLLMAAVGAAALETKEALGG